jgi:hypothetical protein
MLYFSRTSPTPNPEELVMRPWLVVARHEVLRSPSRVSLTPWHGFPTLFPRPQSDVVEKL